MIFSISSTVNDSPIFLNSYLLSFTRLNQSSIVAFSCRFRQSIPVYPAMISFKLVIPVISVCVFVSKYSLIFFATWIIAAICCSLDFNLLTISSRFLIASIRFFCAFLYDVPLAGISSFSKNFFISLHLSAAFSKILYPSILPSKSIMVYIKSFVFEIKSIHALNCFIDVWTVLYIWAPKIFFPNSFKTSFLIFSKISLISPIPSTFLTIFWAS